ncbi:uncharacterized protein METZ01_LOCUS420839 [marine metagenome]|uniref:Uncharacterized protein n=1 Tax=marine metagenome TaxID=408172 RepID=A0A382XBK1_9ZZZZ
MMTRYVEEDLPPKKIMSVIRIPLMGVLFLVCWMMLWLIGCSLETKLLKQLNVI